MARLQISLLGPFRVMLDGQPVASFEAARVRALLAYLAAEASRPHHRERLAGMLWPERPDSMAMADLRQALANLRHAIHDAQADPPFLLISRDTLQLNCAADLEVDLQVFQAAIEDLGTAPGRPEEERLQEALALCKGGFLEGFSLRDSPGFDEWLLLKREQVNRQVLSVCKRLGRLYEERGEYERAEQYVRRQLELDPWLEEAHRQLMRLLALSGRRNEALAHYEACRLLLADELGAVPSQETTALYEAIRSGAYATVRETDSDTQQAGIPRSPLTRAHFVAREDQLARLEGYLQGALAGEGRVVFITGEAGSGKTALAAEFARRAMQAHGELAAAGGMCGGPAGLGDPYLPFRNILQMLAGDVEARRAGGSLSVEHARRLWALLPDAVRSLVENGPDLIGAFVPAVDLAARAEALSPRNAAGRAWSNTLAQLRAAAEAQLAGRTHPQSSDGEPAERGEQKGKTGQATDLFEQFTRVLQALARRQSLLLIVDDLQWADSGSINLLFHLARRLGGTRLLLLGLYRADDVALGRDGDRHPLDVVIHELKRQFGDIEIDLGKAEGRQFVEALLDAEPNRLGPEFREKLYRHTEGHALFTVELLRGLQERGDLLKDEEECWVEGAALDWEKVPPRVEAVIAEHLARLRPEWQMLLEAASVEGEVFTAEVVARVLGLDEREVTGWLSGPLSQQHRLVTAESFRRLDGQRLSRYRFRHSLFQTYLHSQLDEVERARLHEAIGNVLEALHGPSANEMALELAWHFERAGMAAKAAHYLLLAGNRAMKLVAWNEALTDFARGLDLLRTLPASAARTDLETALHLAIADALLAGGWGSEEQFEAARQAYALASQQRIGTHIFAGMYSLAVTAVGRGDHRIAGRLAEELSALAKEHGDETETLLAHFVLGMSRVFTGQMAPARDHLERCLRLLEAHSGEPDLRVPIEFVTRARIVPVCKAMLAVALSALGYPEQAMARAHEARAMAEEQGDALSQAQTLVLAFQVRFVLGQDDTRPSREMAEALARLAEGGMVSYRVWAEVMEAWAKMLAGGEEAEAGLAQLRRAIHIRAPGEAQLGYPFQLLLFAEACRRMGHSEEGIDALRRAQQAAEETAARSTEPEMYRLKGELLLARGGCERQSEAEACFLHALELARQQEAKWWELRTATSLARLWGEQGKAGEARELLTGVYNWFTEGFDLPDLREAAALLRHLSEPSNLPQCLVTSW